MKFKVGDKVRIKKDLKRGDDYQLHVNDDMEKLSGKVVTIRNVDKDDDTYTIEELTCFWWSEDMFERIKIDKQKLLEMPIGTKITTNAEDEDYRTAIKVRDDAFEFLEDEYQLDDYEINNDLTLDIDSDYGTRIMKVEEPTYETIYEYEAELQEMTVAEIEKALGHPVKIIKED